MIRYILAFHYIYNDACYVWIWFPALTLSRSYQFGQLD